MTNKLTIDNKLTIYDKNLKIASFVKKNDKTRGVKSRTAIHYI